MIRICGVFPPTKPSMGPMCNMPAKANYRNWLAMMILMILLAATMSNRTIWTTIIIIIRVMPCRCLVWIAASCRRLHRKASIELCMFAAIAVIAPQRRWQTSFVVDCLPSTFVMATFNAPHHCYAMLCGQARHTHTTQPASICLCLLYRFVR